MIYSKLLEPRSERAGIFSEEESLRAAIKEINNSKLSIKSSTRGYSLLYDKKVANPAIAGKLRVQIEKILLDVHWRYVKHLAVRDLKKHDFILIEQKEEENEVYLKFSMNKKENGTQKQKITIIFNKKKWKIVFEISGIKDPSSHRFISSLEARIGKSS